MVDFAGSVTPLVDPKRQDLLAAACHLSHRRLQQWEGELDDGRSLYVRYRHGLLRVGAGEGLSEAIKNSAPETALHCERLGDRFDGVMNYEELRERLRGVLEFADGLVVEEDPEWSSTPSAGDDG